jgi:hypothetical protein
MTSPEPQLKNLKVLVNDVEYVNADFAEVTVSDGPNGVRVQALPFVVAKAGGGPSSAIIEALTAAVQARAEAKAAASDAGVTNE